MLHPRTSSHLQGQDSPLCPAQGYVRRSCLAVAGSSSVARRLNVHSESIVAAFHEAFELSPSQRLDSAEGDPSGAELQLVFRHDCLCVLGSSASQPSVLVLCMHEACIVSSIQTQACACMPAHEP